MNIATLNKVTPSGQPLEHLVVQEIDRQLHMVPRELAQYIDPEFAATEVMKLLSPLQSQAAWQNPQPSQGYHQTLSTMIADAATLSLIRLVCSTAIEQKRDSPHSQWSGMGKDSATRGFFVP